MEFKEANGREVKVIEFLAALHAQLLEGQECLEPRLRGIPDGWRRYKVALANVDWVLSRIYETLPVRTLRHMQRICEIGEIRIRPRPAIPLPDDVQIAPNDDLRTLINAAMAADCAICLKPANEQRGCKLRRALMRIVPPAELGGGSACEYAEAARQSDLGEYI